MSAVFFAIAFVFILIYPKYIFTSKLASNFVRLNSKHAKIEWTEHLRAAVPYENNCFIAELMDVGILGKASRIIGGLFIAAAANTVIMRSVLNSGSDFYIFVTTSVNALVIAVSFACDIVTAVLCCKYLDRKGLFLFSVMPALCFFALSGGLNKFFADNKDALLGTYADE